MRIAVCLAGIVGVAIIAAGHVASAADDRPEQWTLAQANRSVHRFSTSVKAQEMKALFQNNETLDKAVAWCQQQGVTRVYLETFRFGYLVELLKLPREELDALRAPFLRALGQQAFSAPNRVGLILFEDRSWVTLNFNDHPVAITLNGESHDVPAREWLHHWETRKAAR